jgi:hypothetical protein
VAPGEKNATGGIKKEVAGVYSTALGKPKWKFRRHKTMERQKRLAVMAFCLGWSISQSYLFAQHGVPCASVQNHKIVKHKEHPIPGPSAGKALVFLLVIPNFGKGYQLKIALDHRRWVAVANKSEYTFFEADPGRVTLSWYQEGILLKEYDLELQANQTYFLRRHISFGRFDVGPVSESEGWAILKKLQYVTFEPKGKLSAADYEQFNSKFLDGWKQLRPGITPDEFFLLTGLTIFGHLKTANGHTASVTPFALKTNGYTTIVNLCGYQLKFEDNLLASWEDDTPTPVLK